jgi:hypothetical protein
LLATVLAISPIASSTIHIATNEANAFANMKPTMLVPRKAKTFPSAGEYRACNEGDAPVRMWASNSITNTLTGQCVRCVGTMMSFENDGKVPVMLYSFGGLGGRPGRGPGPH